MILNLQTTDPETEGQLWMNAGVLAVSAGPPAAARDKGHHQKHQAEDYIPPSPEELVAIHTKEELLDMAEERKVEVNEHATKLEIATAILAK
jgi:DNA-binding transcriptional LysR family regulator